ncbi:MAG: DUF6036 family nucleotidyltransferase [Acidimicrobiales bacterium]
MPDSEEPTVDRGKVLRLFAGLSRHAAQRGVRIDLFLVGGGAMVLAYNTARTTSDIEGIFEPKALAYELAAEVVSEVDFPVREDWLNDAVKVFPFPRGQIDEKARIYYDDAGLTVRVASPRYLFMMKAWSARESDEDDLKVLWPLCNWQNAEEALNELEASYPRAMLKPATRYMVEGIAEQAQKSWPSACTGQRSLQPDTEHQQAEGTGAVWVQPHTRGDHPVRGYWRRAPLSS